MTTVPPYAAMLGVRSETIDGEVVLTIDATPDIEGRKDFIHGGVIAGLLEMSCYEALYAELGSDDRQRFKPINVSIDFLRGGLMTQVHATAQIVRIGKRIANAHAVAWQQDRTKPIAMARMHLMLNRT